MTKTNGTAKLRLDGYVRVSALAGRREGDASFISPDDQRDKVERWAIGHGHQIVNWETDFDQTGTKLSRPGFDKILERIRTKQTDGIVVAYLSRLSRAGVGDALKLIDEITNEHGAVLGCYSPQIDTADPVMGRFVLTLFLALNAMESARIGANWADARTRALDRGAHIGSAAPFGYRHRADKRLEPDPVTGPIVTEIYQRRAAGQSWNVIANWLRERGVRTRAGQVLGTAARLRHLVDNPVYLGELRDAGLGIRHEGAHPPLTDPVTFEAVAHHRGTRFGSTPRDDALLRGLVRCAGCRYVMNAYTLRHGVHYRCVRRDCVAAAQIKAHDGRGPGLHAFVMEQVLARVPEIDAQAYGADTEMEDVHAAVQSAKARVVAHATDFELEERLGREAFAARGEALRRTLEQAQDTEREALRTNAGRIVQPLRFLRDDLANASIDEQRDALATVIQAVFVRCSSITGGYGATLGRVHITWADDPEIDLPRQGRRDYVQRPFVFPNPDGPRDIGEAVA